MKDILVDTDVILDMLFDNKPFSDSATALFSLADLNNINIYISALSYSRLHEELAKFTSHAKMNAIFRMIFSICSIVEVNTKVLQRALNAGFNDFSRALQYSCALQNERISIIITNNIQEYKNSRLPVMTPSNYLHLFSNKKALIPT
jgi:predicted nucleic acid-binding protein